MIKICCQQDTLRREGEQRGIVKFFDGFKITVLSQQGRKRFSERIFTGSDDVGFGRDADCSGSFQSQEIVLQYGSQEIAGDLLRILGNKLVQDTSGKTGSADTALSGSSKTFQEKGLVIAVFTDELALHSKKEIDEYFAHVWQTMQACIDRGMNTEGVLPGPLRVPRRASALRRMLVSSDKLSNDPMNVIDWVNMFALAVNEENAAGGRVVTAPTNGACGIVPAVLAYYDHFIESVSPDIYTRYFMAAGAIGALYKMNASISGAEVGCQGEVGVACSMAAAGLAELLGGSPEQVCVAAEIGMEHNLGLTCDPVAGQVQVPCIERNAIASVKAINAARMALRRTSAPRVSLDKVIETMYETGKDMNAKYRETSRGGLAIKVQCD